jgi:hypothetical protein
MTDPDRTDLDARLRAALAPGADVVDRVARRALERTLPATNRLTPIRLAWGALALVVASVPLVVRLVGRGPDPSPNGPSTHVFNQGGIVGTISGDDAVLVSAPQRPTHPERRLVVVSPARGETP